MEDDKKLCPLKFIVKSDPYGGFCNKIGAHGIVNAHVIAL